MDQKIPAKMGRPRKEIDFKQLDQLCAIQCTQEEVASFFECSIDTIEARIKEQFGMTFPEYFEEKKSSGRISLRRAQFQSAVTKQNPTMMIWLGKQYLNQSDKTIIENPNDRDQKLIIEFTPPPEPPKQIE